jgi:MFS family permease
LFFSLIAGALVDRMDRKRVMWRVNLIRAGFMAAVAVTALTLDGTTAIVVLYATALSLGICETFFDNAAQAMLPSIVVAPLLEKANGRQYAAEVIANTFVGPPVGALLFSIAIAVPFWADSISFVISALLIASIAGTFRPVGEVAADPAAERRSIRQDIAEGIRWLRYHRLLRTLALLLGVMNMTAWMGQGILVLFATETLGLSPRAYGFLLAGAAIGGVGGGLVGDRMAKALGQSRSLVVAAGSQVVALALTGISTQAWQVAVINSIAAGLGVVWNVITVSLRQSIIPDVLLGRVNSVYRFLGWGGMPIGALLGGFIANAFGLRAPWLVGAAITLVGLLLAAPAITQHAIDEARAHAPKRT